MKLVFVQHLLDCFPDEVNFAPNVERKGDAWSVGELFAEVIGRNKLDTIYAISCFPLADVYVDTTRHGQS